MSNSFKDIMDKANSSKQFRIVTRENGKRVKRVFENTKELKFKDHELSDAEYPEFEDVPH